MQLFKASLKGLLRQEQNKHIFLLPSLSGFKNFWFYILFSRTVVISIYLKCPTVSVIT